MPYTSNNAFRSIFYRKYGNGPAVVLIHGFPEDGNLWRNVWPELEQHYTVFVPDLPGAGESAAVGEDITIERLAESVQAVLLQENIEKAVVAGHSMGGYVTLAFAEKYPQMVQGISMVHSTSAADSDEKKETRTKAMELMRKGGRDAFIKQMVPNLFGPVFKKGHTDVIEQQITAGLEQEAEGLVGFYNAMRNRPDRLDVLKTAGYPVQWLMGKDDTIIPPSTNLRQVYTSEINFVSFYDHCGHMGMLETPERLVSDMKEFIRYCYKRK